jgi:hypothetical protein
MKKKNKKTAPNGRSSTFREQEKWGSQKKKEQVIYLTLSVVIF